MDKSLKFDYRYESFQGGDEGGLTKPRFNRGLSVKIVATGKSVVMINQDTIKSFCRKAEAIW